jgi:indolepyruvate ferredoxin oxidoreductase beta subunit
MTPAGARRHIKIAILAMGGEGGGVLADWIVSLAEASGHLVQTTSVPGVAQRTGATIYYLELFSPDGDARMPVLALMPVPGDVDVVIASELLEAARAVERGLVTPDRTVLIASTHRVFAMSEKTALGDGRLEPEKLIEACRSAAREWIAFDMAAVAEETGSVVSAVLFGALRRSGALPFDAQAFRDAIARGGTGVAASARAFERALTVPLADRPVAGVAEKPVAVKDLDRFPEQAHEVLAHGVARLVGYQDADYARQFLARLEPVRDADRRHGDGSWRLLVETARYLALGMAYEDTIRVAELKTSPERLARVMREIAPAGGEVVEISEYLHPRLQEIAESLPAPLGRFLLDNAVARRIVERLTARGRVVKTTSIAGYLLLRAVASLRRWRRSSLRFAAENRDLDDWLARILAVAPLNYALAVELAELRNLLKGYGDTRTRGGASYARIMAAVRGREPEPAMADRVAGLRAAALADDTGESLSRALAAGEVADSRT